MVRNRGGLAEGWYDPQTKRQADTRNSPLLEEDSAHVDRVRDSPEYAPISISGVRREEKASDDHDDDIDDIDDDDDDTFGPSLAASVSKTGKSSVGPTIPSLEELELQRGALQIYLHLHNLTIPSQCSNPS